MTVEEAKPRNRVLFETAEYYFKKQKSVHIKLVSGTFVNGIITFLESDRLLITDEVFGEMLILFENIKDAGIIPKMEKGK